MDTVQPRNSPDSKAMTQDNVVKSPVYMPKPDNLAGNESGASTTAGLGAPTGKVATGVEYNVSDYNQVNATREPYLNIPYNETDQRSSRSKGGESQDIPEAGRNQYQ